MEFLTKWATELRTLTDFVRQEEVMASRPVADRGQEENVKGCRYPARSDQDSKHVQANSRQKKAEACRDKAKQTHPRREAEGPARLKISMPELHPGVGACGRMPLRVRRPPGPACGEAFRNVAVGNEAERKLRKAVQGAGGLGLQLVQMAHRGPALLLLFIMFPTRPPSTASRTSERDS